MQTIAGAEPTDSHQLRRELALLAAVAPTDAPFLSCYLDSRMGRAECLADVQRRVRSMRQGLHGVARLDLDRALEMTLRAIERGWTPKAQGMAVFARSLAGGRYLSTLRFALPFDNRVVCYRAAEILPLIALLQKEPATSVLLARADGLGLHDFDLGLNQARAWAQAPLLARDSTDNGPQLRRVAAAERPLQVMRRCVASGDRPLLLAGDAAVDALREGGAETLLVADRYRGESHAPMPVDAGQKIPWDPLIELPRLAHERGTRVVLSDADELCYLDGVGCLLHRPRARGAMPLPRTARHLDLVA